MRNSVREAGEDGERVNRDRYTPSHDGLQDLRSLSSVPRQKARAQAPGTTLWTPDRRPAGLRDPRPDPSRRKTRKSTILAHPLPSPPGPPPPPTEGPRRTPSEAGASKGPYYGPGVELIAWRSSEPFRSEPLRSEQALEALASFFESSLRFVPSKLSKLWRASSSRLSASLRAVSPLRFEPSLQSRLSLHVSTHSGRHGSKDCAAVPLLLFVGSTFSPNPSCRSWESWESRVWRGAAWVSCGGVGVVGVVGRRGCRGSRWAACGGVWRRWSLGVVGRRRAAWARGAARVPVEV